MRSTRVTSIVYTGMVVLGGLGASVSCALDSGGEVPGSGGAGGSGTMGGTVTTDGSSGPTGTPTTSGSTGGVMNTVSSASVTTSGEAAGSVGGTSGTMGGVGGSTGGMMTSVGGMGGNGGNGTTGDGGATATGTDGLSGATGMGGATGTTGTGTTGSTGECVKGQTRGQDVAMIGESFIAFTHQITQQVENRAQAAGSLPAGERYIDNSVSGTTLANNQIGSQYTDAVQESGHIKYVLMDGGGNDCLINNNGAAALTAAEQLFQTMAENNTEKVVYFFYPDPIGNNFASLKSCLDELRPQMKAICDGLTAPKCYWLDLREVWDGHPEYTSDGIHPTTEGSVATGDAIWEVMVENCVAQ